jgi:hypothetical protein
LTLTGLDTLSNYQTTLDSVTFNDTSLNPTNYGSSPTRSITWILTDPSGTLNGGVNVSTPVTTTISITAIDNPPTLSKVATTAMVRGPSQIVTLSPALAVSDPDNLTLAGATVSVSGGAFPGDGDVLAATTASTSITASYNSVTETLALSGTDTLAHYAQVLDSVTFASTGATPANSGAHPTRTVSWVLNDGSASNNLSAAAATTVSIAPVVSYNFNGDGFADLLFQNTNATPQIWLMNGASIVSNTTLPQPPATWKIVGSGDFNGDGNADMLWLNTVTNQPAIWEMNGTAIISAVGLPAPPPSWRVAGIGDFFGNGDADILWQNADGTPAIWQMNGTSLVSAVALPAPPPSWKIAATGDFNGDGKGDILWQNADGTPAIWEMNGDSIVSAVALTPQPANMEIIGTGDFSGTGDADILWLNTATNAPVIWMMDGTSVVGTATLPAPPPSWRLVGTSDLYGTGKADILWQNSNGAVSVWQMNGTSIVTAVDAGNPGASWILNNNDPPLPMAVQPSTNAVLGPIMTGGVAPSFIAGGTTVANTAHFGGG